MIRRSVLAALAVLLLAAPRPAGAADAPVLQSDKLLVLSTNDVMGKTGPCGCHVPKGGLARRATFVDSLRALYGQVLLVDNGGYVPLENERRDVTGFLMDAMRLMGTDAVGVSDRDLKFGREFLVQRVAQAGLPVTSANLLDKATGKPLFPPYLLKKTGAVTVGMFSVLTDQADLGPSKDSLAVAPAQETAKRMVAELRKKGAQVIVLLAQTGGPPGEDLVTAVEGIDVAIMGRNVSLIERGRRLGKSIACYGGTQGHYVCRTELTLDAARHVREAETQAVMLGPEITDSPAIAASVKAFEDALSQKTGKSTAAETKDETEK